MGPPSGRSRTLSSEDILRPDRKPKNRKRRAVTPALARAAARAVDVPEEDVRAYSPTQLDLEVADAMLAGAITQKDIAEMIGKSPETVGKAMRNPVTSAWLSTTFHKVIRQRLGLVDVAVFAKAIGGNIQAAKLAYERFGQLVHRTQTMVGHVNFDPSKLSDEDLDKILAADNPVVIEAEVKPDDAGGA